MANNLLANALYSISAAGASGFSQLAISCPLPGPLGYGVENTFCVAITNTQPAAPIHVEGRTTWTDANGTSQTTPIPVAYISNLFTFGGSALITQTLTLLTSGQNAIVRFDNVIGSALQIWLYAASTTATNVGASGAITLWRAK